MHADDAARGLGPFPLARAALTGDLSSGGAAAGEEVLALEAAVADMERDDPRLAAWTGAAAKLAELMRRDDVSDILAGRPRAPHLDRVRAARTVAALAAWDGPVVEAWRQTLTPVPEVPPLHRLDVLLKHKREGEASEAYRTRAGLYVLVFTAPGRAPRMCAEWPCDPAVAAPWTDATVLYADPGGPVLAVTSLPAASRVDPVPAVTSLPASSRVDPVPALLGTGGPLRRDSLPLLRMVLPMAVDPSEADFATREFVVATLTSHPAMTLDPALRGDTLRLPWATVRALAAADVAEVRRLLAPDAPRYYHYFGIVDPLRSPDPWTVVRRSATPDGHAIDEHHRRDGTWTPSTLLTEIRIGKRDDDHVRLTPDEAARWRPTTAPR